MVRIFLSRNSWRISSHTNMHTGTGFFAKEEMTALVAVGTDCIEVRGVTVKFEDHVTGVVADCAGGVGGAVVEKLVAHMFWWNR